MKVILIFVGLLIFQYSFGQIDTSKYSKELISKCLKPSDYGNIQLFDSIVIVHFMDSVYTLKFPTFIPNENYITYSDSETNSILKIKRIYFDKFEYDLTLMYQGRIIIQKKSFVITNLNELANLKENEYLNTKTGIRHSTYPYYDKNEDGGVIIQIDKDEVAVAYASMTKNIKLEMILTRKY